MSGTRTTGVGHCPRPEEGSARELLRQRDGIPLYLKLASLFREKIRCGDWPIHSQLPTLPALRDEYGLARETVRQALGVLRNEGMIDSTRGLGTFVTAAA